MSKDNVVPIPVWKANSTAEEFFMELAHHARAHPGDFRRVLVVYHGHPSEGGDGTIRTTNRHETNERMATFEMLGLLEMGRVEVLRLNAVQQDTPDTIIGS